LAESDGASSFYGVLCSGLAAVGWFDIERHKGVLPAWHLLA